MWSPLDKSALPSREEIVHAEEAIKSLEDSIRDAFELIESTKLRIAVMKRDLEERRGWIAPIRKVPTEILIDILLWASEMNDLAPVQFAAVCRLWRKIILATPKAWSFINLKENYEIHVYFRDKSDYHDYFPGYKNMYFERSKPRLLHLALPKAKGFYTKHSNSIIKEQAHRLQCLTTHPKILSDTQSSQQCQQFPHLKSLKLTERNNGDTLDTSFFTVSRFPTLQTLHWPCCYRLTAASPTISPSNFPPLQHLSVEIGSVPSCMDILRSCAATLKTLRVGRAEGHATPPPLRIDFPLLKFLILDPHRNPGGSLPLVNAPTPVLTSLVIDGYSQIPTFFEADLRKVTHIRVDDFPALPLCAPVQVLQVGVRSQFIDSKTTGEHAERAKKLEVVAAAHPSLEIVEISSKDGYNLSIMQQKVEECLGGRLPQLKLLWTEHGMTNLPGNEHETCHKTARILKGFKEYSNGAFRSQYWWSETTVHNALRKVVALQATA